MNPSEEAIELLSRHADQLSEHFDTVQIFATSHDPDKGTVDVSYGNGNFFARVGQVSEWMMKVNERSKEFIRREDNED